MGRSVKLNEFVESQVSGIYELPRALTYNVHRCLGLDGRLSPGRVAQVIAACHPDIVALQELDVRRVRSGGIDQAHTIAQELGMHMHFHPALGVAEELYGDAILTAQRARLVQAGPLPGLPRGWGFEPRGALWASIQVDGAEVQLINTHLGLDPRERLLQVEALLSPEWLGHPACQDPGLSSLATSIPSPAPALTSVLLRAFRMPSAHVLLCGRSPHFRPVCRFYASITCS